MADPFTWIAVMAVASAAYTGYTQHETAMFNKKMASQEAEYQRQLGVAKEARQRRAVKKAQGEAGVAAASAGVSLLSGSILDAFTESATEGALDAIMIRTGAKNAERGALIKAEEFGYAGQTSLVSAGLDIGTAIAGRYAKGSKAKPGGDGGQGIAGGADSGSQYSSLS